MRPEVKIWINNGRKINEAVALLRVFGVKFKKQVSRFEDKESANAWVTDYVYRLLCDIPDHQEPSSADMLTRSADINQQNDEVGEVHRTISRAKSVTAFTAEQKQLQQEHSLAHSNMRAATTDEERHEHATKIMEEIIPAKERAYAAAVQAETVKPEQDQAQDAAPTLSAEDVLKRNSARVQVSKLKRKMELETDAKRKAALRAKLEAASAKAASFEMK